MKSGRRLRKTGSFWAVLGMVAMAAVASAQAPAPAKPDQNKPTQPPAQQAPAPNPPSQGNPFPEDNGNVPVLPSANAPAPEPAPAEAAGPAPALPSQDVDPVRSPDEPLPETPADSSTSSSSSADLARILEPPPDTDTKGKGHRKGKNQVEEPPEHQETAQEDENVGEYYLGQKNWRAALSRYQSAVVLDPENPDVYWGLAESQRHLGDMANAKANYQKVMEYDPDSKHAKEAKKLLKEPELANAPAPAAPR